MTTIPILLAAAIALPIVCSSASAQVCGNGVFLGQRSANNPYATQRLYCAATRIENLKMELPHWKKM